MTARKMTLIGYNRINEEIEQLWNIERPQVVEEVYQAALLGDRSENAAYIYGKKRLREIDSRLRFLRSKIIEVQVIDELTLPARADVVFGALVVIEVYDHAKETTEERIIRLVDQAESLPKEDRISIQSPIGSALLGKLEEESFELVLPKGKIDIELLEVHYGPVPELLREDHRDRSYEKTTEQTPQ
jgi:transcription elongation factor GreB